jgi:hypothetical protein
MMLYNLSLLVYAFVGLFIHLAPGNQSIWVDIMP